MKHTRSFLQLLAAICVVCNMTAARPFAPGTTITVNTTQETIFTNANCSIREAIQAANTNLAVDACTAGIGNDTIAFNIGGGGAHTITLTSPISVTSILYVDGRTQPGYASVPLITLSGTAGASLLDFQAGSSTSTVRGMHLTINSATPDEACLRISSDNTDIRQNYINTDGTAAEGSSDAVGVLIVSGSGNDIGGSSAADRNLFGGVSPVLIENGDDNTVRYNYFGLQADGVTALTWTYAGMYAIEVCGPAGSCTGTIISKNIIGNYQSGIRLNGTSQFSAIRGNTIGLGADGTTRLGNTYGVYVDGSHDNTIGGMTAADRNVLSGNNADVEVEDDGAYHADNNVIIGNYIGTTADGLHPARVGGDLYGVMIDGGDGNQVGGTDTGKANLISGNQEGVRIGDGAANTLVLGNWIGPDATGAAALTQATGVYVEPGATVFVGTDATPGENVISGNNMGIRMIDSTGNTIYGNRFGLAARGNYALPNDTAITMQSTSSATIASNWIGWNTTGISVESTATMNSGSSENCFSENDNYAVFVSDGGAEAPMENNWWGRPTGPTHPGNPGGTGDHVQRVDFSPFLTEPPSTCHRTLPDYDGDGHADAGYFHPSTGVWGILRSAFEFDYGSPVYFSWGTTGDIVVSGDYDGDGLSDPTVRRPPAGGQSAAYLMLLSSTGYDFGSSLIVPAGWPGLGDTPVPGDYNADGISDPAIWRGNTGAWIIPLSPTYSSYQFYSWGVSGDTPIGADVDGDGKTDIGYWHPATGVWGFLQSSMGYSYGSALFFSWGTTGDIAVMTDYDGDGLEDPAVVIPPSGGQSRAYRILLSTLAYDPAASVTVPAGWPGLGDTPVPEDYDGDLKADPGVWRANTGIWIVPASSSGYTEYHFLSWGASGDQIAR